MDAAHPRHQGTGGLTPGWPVPVPVLPDELFSSWLVRAAVRQGCDPLVLTGGLWPQWRCWTRDPDRGLNRKRLSVLSKASGVNPSALDAMTLRPIVSAVDPDALDRLSTWPWVLALGARNRRRRGGLQYCPLCLQEDKTPYYRLQWRLAWHTICADHRTFLLDGCPICNAPIEPHRLEPMDESMAVCATCKGDLRKTTPQKSVGENISFQSAADLAVNHGHGRYGGIDLSSNQWFSLARYFITLVRKASTGKLKGLTALVDALGVDVKALTPAATGLALELLPVDERAMLLAGARRLLKAGPERLLEAAKQLSITASTLKEPRQPVPDCIKTIIQALPENPIHRKRSKKNNLPTPRSRLSVMRMWARLQRKCQDRIHE